MKTNRYPITRNFDGRVIGYVELMESEYFTMMDVLSPSVSLENTDVETGKKVPVKLLEFGLINGKNYLKDFEKPYGKIDDKAKTANANI